MSKQHDDVLQNVAEDTFESLAFLLPMPESDESVDCPSATVTVDFAGPFNGRLVLTLPTAALAELAGNMLGLDDEEGVPTESRTDAMKELGNVVCGNVLPAIAGTSAVFDVAAPKLVSSPDLPDRDGLLPAAEARIFLDSGPAAVELLTDVPLGTETTVVAEAG